MGRAGVGEEILLFFFGVVFFLGEDLGVALGDDALGDGGLETEF